MGYRLSLEINGKEIYNGTKLYGYCDQEKTKSYQYLDKLGKITDDMIFCDCISNKIVLNYEQFKKFIKLYAKDCNSGICEYNAPHLLEEEPIKRALKYKGDITMYWR